MSDRYAWTDRRSPTADSDTWIQRPLTQALDWAVANCVGVPSTTRHRVTAVPRVTVAA